MFIKNTNLYNRNIGHSVPIGRVHGIIKLICQHKNFLRGIFFLRHKKIPALWQFYFGLYFVKELKKKPGSGYIRFRIYKIWDI